MTILLTGGTGKTAMRIARLLKEANQPVLLTSRKGVVPEPFKGVKFDWYDPSTFENALTAEPDIDRIYLVAPTATSEVFPPMKPFIDLAVQKGVKRFVLLTGTTMTDGYPLMGLKVHEYLLSLNVDYAVIRPPWFFENFLTWHLRSIKEKNTIISASADGKVGFISADDIADLAVSALTDERSHNTDHIITGPELLTYDDVAAIFTEVLGRKITHTRITVEELKQRYISFGLPEDFAGMLSSLDGLNANGGEEEIFNAPKKVTGKRTLRSFVEANKDSF
ncbi:NAD(P)-binding protein [Armillaria gallica]|uniref:NAD(P)-binding protein n=1 Tax=Armillaria gallica TaxID=47427 RepID=A0A2H3D0L8_ARMGA|nr:NAD(P)-binding protein [Armillaria gallica]